MRRGLLAWLACALAFAAGVLTAALAAENRARGDELDRYERWCEAQSRQNELQRVANQRLEWQLFSAPCPDREAERRTGKRADKPDKSDKSDRADKEIAP